MIARLLDRLLGRRCTLCRDQRVRPAHMVLHFETNHAGDRGTLDGLRQGDPA